MITVTYNASRRGLQLPAFHSEDAAGLDLVAAVAEGEDAICIRVRAFVPTGLTIELPHGYEAQIRPRSGLALKDGVTVLTVPGR